MGLGDRGPGDRSSRRSSAARVRAHADRGGGAGRGADRRRLLAELRQRTGERACRSGCGAAHRRPAHQCLSRPGFRFMAKAFVALIVWLSVALPVVAAQSQPPSKKAPRPAWSELTTPQKQVLAPLQGEWDALDTTRRKKWIAIADRYPKMKPAEQ